MPNTMTTASRQWANRPDDERFWDLAELHQAVQVHRRNAIIGHTPADKLRVEAVDGDVQLVGQTGQPGKITHWAFGQLANRAKAPAGYLRQLPATLAVQNINHGLKNKAEDGRDVQLLLNRNGGFQVRSIHSEEYGRIWNVDLTSRLLQIGDNWQAPPAYVPSSDYHGRTRLATPEDAALSLTVVAGDTIAPAGLYASLEDMFIFMIDPSKNIVDGSSEGLSRGFIIQNSEVAGKSKFRCTSFLHRGVCGNHLIWGAQGVSEVSIVHRGRDTADAAFDGLDDQLIAHANASSLDDETRIRAAQRFMLGKNKDEVLDLIFAKLGRSGVTRKTALMAYDTADQYSDVDGDPKTAWSYAQGLTRVSQGYANADNRTQLDRAAGRVIEMAF